MITFNITETHCELLLRSLELYSYNLHYLIKEDSDEYYYKNMDILHTYNELLNTLNTYKIGYNVVNNCSHEINYHNRKKFKKISA